MTVEPSEDGFMAFDDDLRIVVLGDTEAEARDSFADALRMRRYLDPCPWGYAGCRAEYHR